MKASEVLASYKRCSNLMRVQTWLGMLALAAAGERGMTTVEMRGQSSQANLALSPFVLKRAELGGIVTHYESDSATGAKERRWLLTEKGYRLLGVRMEATDSPRRLEDAKR